MQISYNFLNLPSVVTQGDTPVAEYSWFADGRKYRVLSPQNNGYIYIGSLIYASNNGNLNYLDYGARMYDSNIARWTTQDPLAEKYYAYSQYSFSGNNPILNIDNDGKAWDTFIDAAFLIYDLGSALYNHIIGEHNKAKQNWKDVGIDAASMIIPGVAAPMMKGVGKVASETV